MKTQSKIEEELNNLFTDDSMLNIESVNGKMAAVVNTTKLAKYIHSQQSVLLDRVLEIVGEERKKAWRFYHEAQLWEEQKQIARIYDDLKSQLEKLKGEV